MRNNEYVFWQFNTANFQVTAAAVEDNDLDLSWDDDGSTREGLQSGLYQAFGVIVRATHTPSGASAESSLFGCIYENVSDFIDHRGINATGCGSYFSGMVREACQDLRQQLASVPRTRGAA